jgi:hypothetical protein
MYMTYFFYVYCTYIVQKWYYILYIYYRFLTYLVYIPVLSYHMTHYFSKMKNKKTPHRRDSSKIQSIIVDRGKIDNVNRDKIDSRRQRQNR